MTQDEFSQEAIRRAPVAEGTLTALAVLFSEERIAALYERHRGASYEGVISFHSLVELMYSAVIEHKAVGSSAFQSARKTGNCPFQIRQPTERFVASSNRSPTHWFATA